MKLIVGLGNIGEKYEKTRHNVGFLVADELAKRVSSNTYEPSRKFKAEIIQESDFILAKPTTYMNNSGVAVAAICRFYKVKYEDLYIVHDDLDIVLGNYKIQFGKGPKVHNGLLSVEQQLGTDQFWNVRVGVENREVKGNSGIPGIEYSLMNFTKEEAEKVVQVVTEVAAELKTRII